MNQMRNVRLIKEIAKAQDKPIDDKEIQDIYEKVACGYVDGILNKQEVKPETKSDKQD